MADNKWRDRVKDGSDYGLRPEDFDTEEEYNEALEEAEEQRKANSRIYRFCKVCLNERRPFYYYLAGDLELNVGDNVIVPFGRDNMKVVGLVMAVGACYGIAFPCQVSEIKTVLAKLEQADGGPDASKVCSKPRRGNCEDNLSPGFGIDSFDLERRFMRDAGF